jgi:hypothetical protein
LEKVISDLKDTELDRLHPNQLRPKNENRRDILFIILKIVVLARDMVNLHLVEE